MTISTVIFVCPSVPCICWKLTPVFADISQYGRNKSYLVCVMREKYAFWVILNPWDPWAKAKPRSVHYNIGRGEAKLRISKLTLVFHYHPNASPKQLCVSTPRMYLQSGYFLEHIKSLRKSNMFSGVTFSPINVWQVKAFQVSWNYGM